MQVVTDFFDELKSRSRGYASMEYHVTGYRPNDLVRLDIKINNEVRAWHLPLQHVPTGGPGAQHALFKAAAWLRFWLLSEVHSCSCVCMTADGNQ